MYLGRTWMHLVGDRAQDGLAGHRRERIGPRVFLDAWPILKLDGFNELTLDSMCIYRSCRVEAVRIMQVRCVSKVLDNV